MASIPSDLDIAQAATPIPISDLASSIGIEGSELIPYGSTKAKVHLDILKRIRNRPRGKYISMAIRCLAIIASATRCSCVRHR